MAISTCGRAFLSLVALSLAPAAPGQWQTANPPALPGSGMPSFATSPSGEVYLSWIEPVGTEAHALRVSHWTGRDWAPAETIAQGKKWFVNWADFPAVSVASDGSMLAHWLARPESGGKYGYGIRVAHRAAGPGGTWREVAAFNEHDPENYAGFLSFAGRRAAYLSPSTAAASGHHGGHEGHIKTLRVVEFGASGKPLTNVELDADVCSCCQTATAETPAGLLIAYRDHLPGEIRDISIVRVRDGKASAPQVLHHDGWKINACPTEGPSMSGSGRAVGIAWITRAGGETRLKLAWSPDGGEHFGSPVVADDGNAFGRPQLAAIDERESLLVWMERNGDNADVRVRRVSAQGLGPSLTVASVAAARSAGLPRIAIHRDQVLVAWRSDSVRAVRLSLSAVPPASSR